MLHPNNQVSPCFTSLILYIAENSHMAHIKQARLLSRPVVTRRMAEIRILQRHREPRKRNHPRTMGHMQIVELRLPCRLRRSWRRGIPDMALRQRCPGSKPGNRASSGRAERELSRKQTRAIDDGGSGLGGQRLGSQKANASSQGLESRHYELVV